MKLIVRWLISALALFVAGLVVPGITVSGNAWIAYAVMAVVLGLVNAIIRPLLKLLTCPLIILTLGLFTIVINTVMLLLTSRVGQAFGSALGQCQLFCCRLRGSPEDGRPDAQLVCCEAIPGPASRALRSGLPWGALGGLHRSARAGAELHGPRPGRLRRGHGLRG